MNILIVLIPVSICLGAAGLAACLWTLRNGQYDDLEGDAARILLENGEVPNGEDRQNPRPDKTA
ncbi:MAG: cbb3-type cytochrome oxidase assembly protein CcoS [Sulfitobacter sp.]|jgi:cbb3-type cytochrome oxidase maturation protein|uniref:Cbb3-type cytochrome oxidase assembly protein CcoS n=1 Tax=Sulfitobacter profundi TaxID=2679961 RepID=A0ABW1Z0J9_9RHOB|nr:MULTISPECIES: cbb3-type cytochrome oxidase assembly protein CcoS [Sulfitobacter]KZZ28340.1 cytochrome C oxidase Cbb3 [Sulfitobacter sp. HI0082]HAC50564.1 cbb3-type cytochrome oxidase assembly protein CcoS [Sulfitobacter sp.]AYE86304.1 cbb3-type cytochrome oxidase assembly protein CcoS [Sulfitobacter sp. D7]KZX94415.1 cytochrome C oxidase Cbb3 [Sulfitobacter sp. HI0021]KZY01662.1 cytochrome C oxidase Cbb3 [Sulfitobacter sp. HI0027]|tara:strand:- start:130 stop:321 length:192 start_codon:yes stop_codon:yes gene_type:complete